MSHVVFEEWTHAGPGLGPVHQVAICEEPWAQASFEQDPAATLLVHWDGAQWTVVDEPTFCYAERGSTRSLSTGEGQLGRLWSTVCSSAAGS